MQEILNKPNGHSLPPNRRNPKEFTLNEEQLKDLIYNATSRDTRALRQLLQEKRDYDNECDYPRELSVQEHYKFYFDYHAVATRVCEVYPMESWQVQPSVFEDDDPNVKTEFEKAWDELGSSLRGQSWHKQEEGSPVWEYLKRADVLSGIGSFGVILLGFDDGQPLNTPVAMLPKEDDKDEEKTWDTSSDETDTEDSTETVSGEITGNAIGSIDSQYNGGVFGQDKIPTLKEGTKRKLIFMRPFDESLVQVTRLETDINSPRHNQPVMYRLTLIDPDFAKEHNISMDISCPEVHWTRIIHIADNLTNSECFGVPRQQPVYRHLRNLYKLYGGAPEMYWRGALNGLSFETHPQLGGDVDIDKDDFKRQIENYRNGLQRDLLTTGMTVKSVAPQVVDPTPNIEVQITAICIKLGCPKRIFMGSERGELASTQDDSAWNDRLKHRQDTYVTPRIIIPFIDRMIATGVLPKPQGKIIEENLTEDDGNDQEVIETSEDSQTDSSLQGKAEGKPTANAFGKPPSSDSKGGFAPNKGKASSFGGKPSSGAPSGDNVGTGAPAPAAPKARKLPEKDSEPGYTIVWPDLDSMTDAQKATIALQKTQALMAFIAGNGESAMTLVDFYTKVLYLTDEEAIGVIQAVNQQIEDDERLTPDPEQARQEQMEMEGEKFDKELEAKKELAESGQGFQAAMFDKQTDIEDKRLKTQPKGKPVANFNPDQPRDNKGKFSSGGGGGSVVASKDSKQLWEEYNYGAVMKALSRGETITEGTAKGDGSGEWTKADIDGLKEKTQQLQAEAESSNSGHKTVYRGEVYEGTYDPYERYIPGETVKTQGLTATSANRKVAEVYQDPQFIDLDKNDDHSKVLLKYSNPKGVKGANFADGSETVIPHGASYTVKSINFNYEGVFEVELVANLSALDKARLLVNRTERVNGTEDSFVENYSPSQKRDNRGRFGSGGSAGSSKSSKSETAKASAVAVGKEIQNYAKANEASIAKKLGGVSFPDSEPVDVVVPNKAGVAQHGIEMKTMVKNGNFKLTMDGYAQARKVNWEKNNPGSTIHTLVLDDHAVFNANGPGKHDYSKREYYYRRGVAGSARVSGLHKAKDLAEVEKLMKMDESQLPKGAKRSDSKMREGTWKPFVDAEGKGFKNKKTGKIVRAKKDSEE